MPCTTPIVTKNGTRLGSAAENDDCEWDFAEYEKYLGANVNFLIYHNQREFQKDEYDESKVRKRSYLRKLRSFIDTSVWNEGFVNLNEIDDYVSLI